MPTPRLSPHAAAILDSRVDTVFDGLLTRLLGGAFTGKRLYLTFDPELTLPGIFAHAVAQEGGAPDLGVFMGIAEVAKDLLDKYRAGAKAQTKRRVQGLLLDVQNGNLDVADFTTAVEGELTELWSRVRGQVERVVESEMQHVGTVGMLQGVQQINASLGVDDPVVCFLPVHDNALCDECKKVHLLSDRKTPRAWLESEVSTDYHVRGEDRPSWHLMHPHCRCALATVLPGFGFDEEGRISWVHTDFREIAYQRDYVRAPRGVQARLKWLERPNRKTEPEFGQRLRKFDVKYDDLSRAFREHGWQESQGGKHVQWTHPSIPSRPVTIKNSHKTGSQPIDDQMLKGNYLKQAGLRINQQGTIEVHPRHPFAQQYKALGYRVPGEAEEPQVRSWEPAGVQGLVQVPLDQLVPSQSEDALAATQWKQLMHQTNLNRGHGHLVPHVTAMKQDDGTYLIDDGHEQVAAARAAGMTHAPVLPL